MHNIFKGNVIDLSKADRFSVDLRLKSNKYGNTFELRFDCGDYGYVKSTGLTPEECVANILNRCITEKKEVQAQLGAAMLIMIRDMQLGIEEVMNRWRTDTTEPPDEEKRSAEEVEEASYSDVFGEEK